MYVEPLELFNVELGGLKSTILHLFRSPNISLPLDISILLQTSSNHTLKELYVVRLFALEIKFLKNKLVLNSLFGGLDFLSTKFLYVSSSFISGNNFLLLLIIDVSSNRIYYTLSENVPLILKLPIF